MVELLDTHDGQWMLDDGQWTMPQGSKCAVSQIGTVSGKYSLVVMVDTDDERRTTPGVRHKLPTGELKRCWVNCLNFMLGYNFCLN